MHRVQLIKEFEDSDVPVGSVGDIVPVEALDPFKQFMYSFITPAGKESTVIVQFDQTTCGPQIISKECLEEVDECIE